MLNRRNHVRNSFVGSVLNYVWRSSRHRYICSNLYAVGGKMKVTLEFEDIEDAKRAIHAADAWIALSEISELLRSQRKHDTPMEQTLICIQEIVQDTMPLIYS
jgi:hypothetical protein